MMQIRVSVKRRVGAGVGAGVGVYPFFKECCCRVRARVITDRIGLHSVLRLPLLIRKKGNITSVMNAITIVFWFDFTFPGSFLSSQFSSIRSSAVCSKAGEEIWSRSSCCGVGCSTGHY